MGGLFPGPVAIPVQQCGASIPVPSALLTAGHNSDGKFIARAQRIEYDCELVPRRVAIFIEKTKDGQILPVPNVVVRDVACGANHTVSLFLPHCPRATLVWTGSGVGVCLTQAMSLGWVGFPL